MCDTITRNGTSCLNKGRYKREGSSVCGIHLTKHERFFACEAVTCDGQPCSKYGNYKKDTVRYCGVHINMHECCICMAMIPTKTKTITMCNHIFHGECIREWSNTNTQCPICWFPLNLITVTDIDFVAYRSIVTQWPPRVFGQDSIKRICDFYKDNTEMCDVMCTTPLNWTLSI